MDMTKIKENKLKSEEYGYSSSNFASAFKKHLDISLAGFRKLSEQKVEESSFSHGITLDDPSITDEDHCMYELCQTISPNHPALKDSGILTNCFEGGKYAVYHFKGYPQLLFMIYQ